MQNNISLIKYFAVFFFYLIVLRVAFSFLLALSLGPIVEGSSGLVFSKMFWIALLFFGTALQLSAVFFAALFTGNHFLNWERCAPNDDDTSFFATYAILIPILISILITVIFLKKANMSLWQFNLFFSAVFPSFLWKILAVTFYVTNIVLTFYAISYGFGSRTQQRILRKTIRYSPQQ